MLITKCQEVILNQRPLHTWRLSPPISDVFVNKGDYSTLTLLRNSLFNMNKQNNCFQCYKKYLK